MTICQSVRAAVARAYVRSCHVGGVPLGPRDKNDAAALQSWRSAPVGRCPSLCLAFRTTLLARLHSPTPYQRITDPQVLVTPVVPIFHCATTVSAVLKLPREPSNSDRFSVIGDE